MSDRKLILLFLGVFAACWFLPVDNERFQGALHESLVPIRWYAREHVLLCLVPALFIALVITLSTVAGLLYGAVLPG